MSSTVQCQRCGCAELEKDAARGDTVCTSCGFVVEENAIVSEVQFQETGAGGHSVVGQYVGSDFSAKLNVAGLIGADYRASREVTYQHGRQRIQEVASQLRINQYCVDVAFNYFKIAVSRGWTRGRRSTHIVAACLYITCRKEKTEHFLLDFSDVLQVNVFELGKVFNFLARSLCIEFPEIDPGMYVMRFAQALEFGEKENDVVNVAVRLVHRMKKDWMGIGRRPTGLIGAALILSARYHNFNRSISDVMKVVNIGEAVLRRRLEEFAMTPTSALSLDDFQTVNLEEECDPPAFREAKLKAKEKQKEFEAEKLEALEPELLNMQKEFDRLLEEKRKKNKRYSEFSNSEVFSRPPSATGSDESSLNPDDELIVSQEFIAEETLRDLVELETNETGNHSIEPGCSTSSKTTDRYHSFRPTLESLGIKPVMEKISLEGDVAGENAETEGGDGLLDLNGIDDDEIDEYLLRDEEINIRRQLWNLNYEPFMREMEEKRLRREEDARILEEQGGGAQRKRRSKPRKKIQASSVGEAIEKIVQEKKLSSKINYEVLKSLVDDIPGVESFGMRSEPTKSDMVSDESLLSKISSNPAIVVETVSSPAMAYRKKPRPNLGNFVPVAAKKQKVD